MHHRYPRRGKDVNGREAAKHKYRCPECNAALAEYRGNYVCPECFVEKFIPAKNEGEKP